MYSHLLRQLKLPEKFQQPDKMFWQDPHIAKYLLNAHLDPNTEGASRNPVFIEQSVEFIEKMALESDYNKIIDYGCGPGLYCESLYNRGFDVTGVDFSKNSIQYAKKSAQTNGMNIEYRHENYLNVSDQSQYDLALLIYCDYGALSPENRKKLLQNIWNSLLDGGKLLLDVFTIRKYDHFLERKHWNLNDDGGFWSPLSHVEITQNLKYDNGVTLDQTVVLTESKSEVYYIWNQCFTKEMILRELNEAGFTVKAIFNDVTGKDYHASSDTMALLARK